MEELFVQESAIATEKAKKQNSTPKKKKKKKEKKKKKNNKKIWKNYLSRNQLLQLKKQKSKIQHQRWRKQVKGKILKNLRIEDKTKLFILTKKLLKQVFSILKAMN